jgi:nucleoside-diphosphate-sugar epimerase
MKVLLTGLNGFLASNLLAELERDQNIDLTILSQQGCIIDNKINVRDYEGFISQNIDKFDVAILVASSIGDSVENLSVTAFNCSQFHALLLNLKQTNVGRVIHISSASLILQDLIPTSLYLQSKRIQETLITNLDFQSSAILRLSSPIGVGMQENRIFYQMIKNINNQRDFEFFGDINRLQNYIDIRDVVENIILSIGKKELTGTFYLSSTYSISNISLFNELLEALKITVGYKHNVKYEEVGLDISSPRERLLFPEKKYKSYSETAKWILNEDFRF